MTDSALAVGFILLNARYAGQELSGMAGESFFEVEATHHSGNAAALTVVKTQGLHKCKAPCDAVLRLHTAKLFQKPQALVIPQLHLNSRCI